VHGALGGGRSGVAAVRVGAGLLLVGLVDHVEGLFVWAASGLERVGDRPRALLVAACASVALVTAVLNLDTAVVFLTPVLVLAARTRGLDERPFLYAAIFMANASSLFLPGSNLTNLLVLAQEHASGATFASRVLAPASGAVVATTIGLLLLWRTSLRSAPRVPQGSATRSRRPSLLAAGVTLLAAALTVLLPHPALPVLAAGSLASACEIVRGRLDVRGVLDALGAPVLVALFSLSVALGALARSWSWPAHLLEHAGRWETTGIGALAAVTVNNLPAAVLLSARPLSHPRALLLGLNLGPNLAVTGSLSAYLWYRAARQAGGRPSIAEFSRRGVLLAPAAMLAALLAITLIPTPS